MDGLVRAALIARPLSAARCSQPTPAALAPPRSRSLDPPLSLSHSITRAPLSLIPHRYGFNAGSTLAITGAATATAARVFATTTISASLGGITAVVLERLRGARKQWDVACMCNGVLAGLVSITAGCATVATWAALLTGGIGGLVYLGAAHLVLHVAKIDDPLNAFAVHGACGTWGCMEPLEGGGTEALGDVDQKEDGIERRRHADGLPVRGEPIRLAADGESAAEGRP